MKKLLLLITVLFFKLTFSVEIDEFQTVGVIKDIKNGKLYLEKDGKVEEFTLAPLWFIIENGYEIEVGENADIIYFYDNKNKIIRTLEQEDGSYIFADSSGKVYWRRRGFFIKSNKGQYNEEMSDLINENGERNRERERGNSNQGHGRENRPE